MASSCAHCGHDLAALAPEQSLYAPDGALHLLPQAFCPACGWPTARAELAIWPPLVELHGDDDDGELQVTVRNDGDGTLYYSLDPSAHLRPRSLPSLHGRVEPGQRREIGLRVAAAAAQGDGQVTVLVHTLTAPPATLGATRRQAVETLWVSQPLSTTVRAVSSGPISLDREHLFFGLGGPEGYVQVLNHGGAALCGEVTCSGGYLVCAEVGSGFSGSGRLLLRPGSSLDGRPQPSATVLRVRAPEGAASGSGRLDVRIPGLPPASVTLERVVPAPPPVPSQRWTVGIDFGTSKTAVAYVDQLALPPLPQVLTWERLDPAADSRWLPSAVHYALPGGQPSFGDWAFAQSAAAVTDVGVRLDLDGRYANEHGVLFVGMKMFLRGDAAPPPAGQPSVAQVAADFFRHLFEQLEQRTAVRLREAQLVLSVPVLADAATAAQQAAATRTAALAGGALFGLTDDQISFEKEPVCAAVDVVRLLPESAGLQPGDWLCVFDSGAGTTDLSLLQIAAQDGQWGFAQIEALGYEWGGDQLDSWLFDWLLGFWCSPRDPANIPAAGPAPLRPLRAANPPRPPSAGESIDWFAFMRSQPAFAFSGATQAVTRSELLGAVSRFKERHLRYDSPPEARLSSETPLLALGPPKRGSSGPWADLELRDLGSRVALEFLAMRSGEAPLQQGFPALCQRLGLRRPQWVVPVGGTTLVRGWREAVQRPPLSFAAVLEADAGLRRLHVARGAAQRTLFRITDRLPAAATLEVCDWTPGAPPRLLDQRQLSAGAPPGDRQETSLVATLPLQPGQRLLLRLKLGDQVLRQQGLAWYEGQAVLATAGLPAQPALRLQVALGYRRGPTRLELSGHWLLPGDPALGEPWRVELPRFEE
ncbi:MAG: hypothetical protein IT204_09185 [Fimbriimonadaceae bacterium]|nr:hypothetical protein [Fimbriimonadaceae bacterium]